MVYLSKLFMGKLSIIGRIFFGVAIAALGFLTIFYRDFPYMMIPPNHSGLTAHVGIVYISGALLLVTGVCMAIGKMTVPLSLLLGAVLLLNFCFYFVPYELKSSGKYMQFAEWENAAKELALCGGAFVIAGAMRRKLLLFGTIVYCLTII